MAGWQGLRASQDADEEVRGSCGLFMIYGAVGSAQVGPLDIGAHFFAADSAICGGLDRGAILGRDLAVAGGELADVALGYAKQFGQRGLASDDVAGLFDCSHKANIARLIVDVNSPRYIARV